MAEQWYYRFMDQEMGPVDLLTLRSLAADGAIGHSDEVRHGSDGEWTSAESIEGLFPQAADATDLVGMLHAERPAPAITTEREARGAHCYCRLLGVEVGPMTFEQLAALAAAGRLSPQDEVRLNARAEWIEAGSIVGLFGASEMVPPASPTLGEPDSGLDDLLNSHELELAPRAGPVEVTTDDGTRVWYSKVLGHEMGPSTFEEVHGMIAAGQLSRTDELRHGRRGDWVRADSIVGLFPEEEPPANTEEAEPDDPETDAEDEDGYKFDFADFVGDEAAAAKPARTRSRKSKHRKGARAPVRRDAKAEQTNRSGSESETPDRPIPAPPSPPPPRSIPGAPSPHPPTPAVLTTAPVAAPARPVPFAAPKPKRAIGNPFAGVGSAVGGLFRSLGGLFGSLGGGGLGQSWKPLAAAVALGAIAYLIYFGSPFSSSRAPEVYNETLAIWEEANRLKESSAEWSAFKEKTMPRVQQLGKELAEEASSKDRLMQLMLYCHRDCLPQILQSAPDPKGSKWAEMNDYMDEARRLATE